MTSKKKHSAYTNPYDTVRQLAGATHLEVQYFLPYLPAWLPSDDDPALVDMHSVCVALLLYSINGQHFVAGGKNYTQ